MALRSAGVNTRAKWSSTTWSWGRDIWAYPSGCCHWRTTLFCWNRNIATIKKLAAAHFLQAFAILIWKRVLNLPGGYAKRNEKILLNYEVENMCEVCGLFKALCGTSARVPDVWADNSNRGIPNMKQDNSGRHDSILFSKLPGYRISTIKPAGCLG
jgi:hypothetical protein